MDAIAAGRGGTTAFDKIINEFLKEYIDWVEQRHEIVDHDAKVMRRKKLEEGDPTVLITTEVVLKQPQKRSSKLEKAAKDKDYKMVATLTK